ncbi:hypothetical protein Tco_0671405, partial [Tanacetum coccineum]
MSISRPQHKLYAIICWTRESEEYKAEARKVKPQSKSAKKNQ